MLCALGLDGAEVDGRPGARIGFVVASCDAPELLDSLEGALDQMAPSGQLLAMGAFAGPAGH